MKSPILGFLLCSSLAFPQIPQILGISNAATGTPAVSNASIVSIYGRNLAITTAESLIPPYSGFLAGAIVDVCSSTQIPSSCASGTLFYASQTQLNLVIPSFNTSTTSNLYFRVQVNGAIDQAAASGVPFSVPFYPIAPGIFREGWDCAYPATCPLGGVSDSSRTAARGAIVDIQGRLVSSQNPVGANGFYSLYLTGFPSISNPPLLESQLGVPLDVRYHGPAPGYPGLYQINFTLPVDIRRAFTDGIHVPACSLTDDRRELMIGIYYHPGNKDLSDWVSLPIHLDKNQLECL